MSAVAEAEVYPASGENYSTTLLRVYLSSGDGRIAQHAAEVAAEVETAAGALGSTILETVGRWRGRQEPGRVVELAYAPNGYRDAGIRATLESLRDRLGLTFYVTRTAAEAAEVY